MRRRLLPLLLALPLGGCIEDRLSVEVTTFVQADGSCTRRVEYRLVRVDTGKDDARLPIPPAEDVLRRLHRLPQGDAWSVRDEAGDDLHVVTAEGRFASPNEIDWDYWRQRAPAFPPARNHLSFASHGQGPGAVYELHETYLDPASPLEGARALTRLLSRRDAELARALERALGSRAPRPSESRRLFRELFAEPFARDVEGLATRPLLGPRERAEMEAVFDRLDERSSELVRRLAAASPSSDADVPEKVDQVLGSLAEGVAREVEASGLPVFDELLPVVPRVSFRVTLVMPVPIVRANTCVRGDTAVWEFDQDDLYGRGFEMRARAVQP